MSKPVLCSVLVCTYNRAALLRDTLQSLCRQTLNADEFEVIVLDDGSRDETREIATAFGSRLMLRYAYQRNAGLASARNHALFLSQGEIILLLDDDDVASPELLEEHIKTHRAYPQDNFAVLGYTSLSPEIAADPVMHFVTEVGRFLFSYVDIQHGQRLGFSYFWGGRSSCKRRFLLQHGIFNPVFRFGCEDIELAYRLSKHNLVVVYNAHAVTTMVRPYSFDQFCERLIKQGRSNFVFSRLHSDPEVQAWTEVDDMKKWDLLGRAYVAFRKSGRELDSLVRCKQQIGMVTEQDMGLLHEAFWVAFRASKVKGMVEAAAESRPPEAEG
jgi:glycosyltransferase involved in cell wall biosynthesis